MGRSEWGVLVRSRAEARQVLDVAAQHDLMHGQQAQMMDEELRGVEEVSRGGVWGSAGVGLQSP